MKESFEIWAPKEIARLREEAASLQRALDLYLRTNARTGAGSRVFGSAAMVTQRATVEISRTPRGSKYEPLMKAFEEENRALSLNEMINIAERGGFGLDRARIRSLVFAQKHIGRVIPEGDRYLWKQRDAQPESETAPSLEEDAV